MYIKEILRQHRRDFVALFVCEHCGIEHEAPGYDDHYYHNVVVPTAECHGCGKAGNLNAARTPKYADDVII